MAQSIEEFAGPILAEAKKRTKKIQKTVKRQDLALLGVNIANQALRTRATKRAEDWYTGAQPILRQAEQNVREGFNFWDSHNDMLGDYDPSDWRTARSEQLFDAHMASSGQYLSAKDTARAYAEYVPEIQDELDSYENLMNLHSEFRGAIDSTDRERLSTNYYGTIQAMIDNERTRIGGDSSIFNSLMGALGIHSKDRLDDIDVRTTEGMMNREGLSADEQTIASFFDRATRRRQEASELRERAARPRNLDWNLSEFVTPEVESSKDVYGRYNEKWAQYIEHLAAGNIPSINEDLKVYGLHRVTMIDPEDSSDTHDLTFAEVLGNIQVPETGENPQARLIGDVSQLASVLEWKYEKGAEAHAQDNNLIAPMAPLDKQHFFNLAFRTLIEQERFDHEHTTKILGMGGSPSEMTYMPLSKEELTVIANGITSTVPSEVMEEWAGDALNPDFFDSGNQERLQELIVEQEEVAQRTPQRNAFSADETSVSQLREQIISAQENDPNYNPVQAQGVIDTYIAENPDLTQDQQEDLRSIIESSTPTDVDVDLSGVSIEGASTDWLDNIGVDWSEDLPGVEKITRTRGAPPLLTGTSFGTITLTGLTRKSSVEEIREHLEQIILADTGTYRVQDAKTKLAQLNERYGE
tara:strand:+ start:6397 stop:8316 length:1920 start_codon:yes stop_codon:yes gene_type:complete